MSISHLARIGQSGCDTALHISGKAYITDDPALLSTMALTEKSPLVALIVHVEYARIFANTACESQSFGILPFTWI
jgi:hypothetical protein